MKSLRVWSAYASLWLPVAVLYAVLIAQFRGVPPGAAVVSGISYVIPPALLGVGLWLLSRWLTWPTARPARFFAIHALLAGLFSALWLLINVAWIAWRAGGWRVALDISRDFAGWQMLSGLWAYGLVVLGVYAIRIATRLREQEAIAARADALRMRAELAALRGQLNPHFLFNTLHTVT